MKKLVSLLVAIVMMLLVPVTALAENDTVTVTGNAGYTNVLFSNEYRGFCIDQHMTESGMGDSFTLVEKTEGAVKNNVTGTDVSQELKVILTQYFEEYFLSDGNGGYQLDDYKAGTVLQAVIWNYTDNYYIWGEQKKLVEKVNAYDGPEIPDRGYVRTLENGDVITYDFMVMKSNNSAIQDFFSYKIAVSHGAVHEHDYSEKWSKDDEGHWHECECGDKADVEEHKGGEADCVNKAECEICEEAYGNVDETNHTGETEIRGAVEATEDAEGYTGDVHCKDCGEKLKDGEVIPKLHRHDYSEKWSKDDEGHWHECECGDKADVEEHKGGEADCVNKAECEICEETYGNIDETNHTGETEIRGAVEATEEAEGYTGDVHCKDCGEKLKDGEVIPKLHKHDYSEEWSKDGEEHWHECECGDKADVEKHKGGEADCVNKAECEICEEAYGNVDKTNHTGETEIRGAVEATEEAEGYTGDIHCKDCGEKLKDGEVIPKLHKHDYSEEWSKDGEEHWHECDCGDKADVEKHDYSEKWSKDAKEHWHECECGDKADVEEHKGGEADCVNKAECEICEEAYGNVDKTNHTGETEIRGAVEATEEAEGYTGDVHCKDCGEKLKDGEVIPKLHKHDYSEEWSKDGKQHWHECECGDKADVEEHKGGEADCVNKAECEICEEAYGNVDKTNHTGETEIRGAVEATEESEGYTGDVYCKDCGEKIEDGEVILVIHEHFYNGGWSKDGKEHWHECECGNKTDVEEHTYKDGRCTVCGAEEQSDSTPEENTPEEDTPVEKAPETSDISTPYFYFMIMLMSLVSVGFALRFKRK